MYRIIRQSFRSMFILCDFLMYVCDGCKSQIPSLNFRAECSKLDCVFTLARQCCAFVDACGLDLLFNSIKTTKTLHPTQLVWITTVHDENYSNGTNSLFWKHLQVSLSISFHFKFSIVFLRTSISFRIRGSYFVCWLLSTEWFRWLWIYKGLCSFEEKDLRRYFV